VIEVALTQYGREPGELVVAIAGKEHPQPGSGRDRPNGTAQAAASQGEETTGSRLGAALNPPDVRSIELVPSLPQHAGGVPRRRHSQTASFRISSESAGTCL
jgi:hypothetical protein